jgi:hypothetical protein
MNKVRQKNENKLKLYLNGNNQPTTGSTRNCRKQPQADKGNHRKY